MKKRLHKAHNHDAARVEWAKETLEQMKDLAVTLGDMAKALANMQDIAERNVMWEESLSGNTKRLSGQVARLAKRVRGRRRGMMKIAKENELRDDRR